MIEFTIGSIDVMSTDGGHPSGMERTYLALANTSTASLVISYYTLGGTQPKTADIIIQPANYKDYGDDIPQAAIRLTIENGEVISHFIGRNTATGYVDKNDDQWLIFAKRTNIGNVKITDDNYGNVLRIFKFISSWIDKLNYEEIAAEYVALGFSLDEDGI